MNTKPKTGEFPAYYSKYTSLVPDDVLPFLVTQKERLMNLMASVPPEKVDYSYAPGKWTLKQSMIHVVETERIFTYRSLVLSRKDEQDLIGFDQDQYVVNHQSDHLSWEYVMKDMENTRNVTIHQFNGYNDEQWNFNGHMVGQRILNKALAYIVAGHVEHHIALTKSRYLS